MRFLSVAPWCALSLMISNAIAGEPTTYPLWHDGAPGALGKEVGDDNHAGDIPTISVYMPSKEKANGASVVICPGGGYGFLATEHEGREVAEWLNSLGITAVVLKYRLAPQYKHPAPLEDAQRAIRTVRAKSKEWNLDPTRVGIIGFSAGGHLASTASTHFVDAKPDASPSNIDGYGTRPDIAILVYPVVSLGTEFGHGGSRDNLLGPNAPEPLLKDLTNENQVTDKTPPTFLAHTLADTAVPVENSVLYAMALRKAKVPFELHIFESGQHGLGLGTGWTGHINPDPAFQAWPKLCEAWLKSKGFTDKP